MTAETQASAASAATRDAAARAISPRARMARAAFLGSLGLLALLALVDALPTAPQAWLVLACALAALVAWRLVPRLDAAGRRVDWLLAVAALQLLVLGPELVLRAVGFRHRSGVQEFAYPPTFRRFEPDPELFWKWPEGTANSFGFQDAEPVLPKPVGEFRTAFLGDSCTWQGWPREAILHLEATRAAEEPRYTGSLLAMPGYSSHQGAIVAARAAPRLQANLAFVWFGWNDHWLAWGEDDEHKQVRVASRAWQTLHDRCRTLQWLTSLAARARLAPTGGPRVPPDAYRANLTRIAEAFARSGTAVVFVTAPSDHERRGVPPILIERGFAKDAASVIDLHRRYVEITRDAARATGSSLLDIAAEFDARSDPDTLFLADGTHFTDVGLRVLALRVAPVIREHARAASWPR